MHNEAIPYLVLYVLLNKYHYNAISYVSLFETIYFHKAEFDDELQNAISNWEEGISQILPFVRYLIEKLKELYEQCDHIISPYVEDSNLNKGDNIENTILNDLPNIFTKEEIRLNHPYVSESTINRALKKLFLNEGQLILAVINTRGITGLKDNEKIAFSIDNTGSFFDDDVNLEAEEALRTAPDKNSSQVKYPPRRPLEFTSVA